MYSDGSSVRWSYTVIVRNAIIWKGLNPTTISHPSSFIRYSFYLGENLEEYREKQRIRERISRDINRVDIQIYEITGN